MKYLVTVHPSLLFSYIKISSEFWTHQLYHSHYMSNGQPAAHPSKGRKRTKHQAVQDEPEDVEPTNMDDQEDGTDDDRSTPAKEQVKLTPEEQRLRTEANKAKARARQDLQDALQYAQVSIQSIMFSHQGIAQKLYVKLAKTLSPEHLAMAEQYVLCQKIFYNCMIHNSRMPTTYIEFQPSETNAGAMVQIAGDLHADHVALLNMKEADKKPPQ